MKEWFFGQKSQVVIAIDHVIENTDMISEVMNIRPAA